ncbi:16S rRNA (uracil(1498)-N(3))-methyltransferase [Candidatus Uhrbacteria bacterium]|nr:16S rRNA (uracil(1498)-N(3))-methyltransferase [Candidatus Uhrbacteria bacterium]
MKRHRFIGPYDLRSPEIVLEDDAARQMALVLKLKIGEGVILSDGLGHEAEYEILQIKKSSVRLVRDSEISTVKTEPTNRVMLYASILKRENFELVVQKATECGVLRIVPVLSQRTIKKDVKLDRLREIAKEAAELSGRGTIPEIAEPMKLEQALNDAEINGQNYFFDRDAAMTVFKSPASGSIGLFIGPEGGWTPEEAERAKEAGCKTVSLGPRVLRGETAAIVAVFLAVI